ncbi:MAG: general secretion pathway protein GspK [Deltaproteobacteria bacterium]|nr:general secretion pathway protein GspK [Deltaproteobacteria bacterium]
MKGILRNNRGMALILTILVISLIVALTLQFNASMRSDLQATANLRDGVKMGYIAKSGFNYALAVLSVDSAEGSVDSLHDTWADSKALSENAASLFDEGRIEVKISDHSARIQVNRLVGENGEYNAVQKGLMTRFLNSPAFGLSSEDVDNIVDAIKDWIDGNSEVTKFGAENTYYQTLEKPYSCKNAPLEFVEELLLVRGITKDLFYGTEERPGISHYLSTYGDGKINVNNAGPLILRALSDDMDDGMVEEMVSYREDEESDLSDPAWYKTLPGMGGVKIPDELLTTSSTYFEVTSDGFRDNMAKRISGIVERTEGKLDTLSWKIE